jgi:plasmid stabilization system protein ParE
LPQRAWSKKRERQYEHIKDSLIERGRSEDKAEEVAARTVNKTRAQEGEAMTSSKLSREDISSSRRGGLRSHGGPKGRTRDQLYEEAKRMKIKGRSSMSKEQLRRAVDAKK